MNKWRRRNLGINLVVCQATIKNYLTQLDTIEKDAEISVEDKLEEIKMIRVQINEVGTEIDILKKEITLLESYSLN